METLNLATQMPKRIFPAVIVPGSAWISRAFVTATRHSKKQCVNKETCENVKEAAEAVREGMKETRQTGQFLKETVNANAGEVITEIAKKQLKWHQMTKKKVHGKTLS